MECFYRQMRPRTVVYREGALHHFQMEALCCDPAYHNWGEKVKELHFKVQCRWSIGEVDEVAKLKSIGMHYHAIFLIALLEMAENGEVVKARQMAASVRLPAKVVTAFMDRAE